MIGTRLPEDESVVLEDGNLVVGIELEELRLALLSLGQIDEHELYRDAEVHGGHDGAAGVAG